MCIFFGQELYFHTRLSASKKLAGENAEPLKSQMDKYFSRESVETQCVCGREVLLP